MTIDPENPFVWNDRFFSNVTKLPYYKTMFYYVHVTSNGLAFVIGAFLIALLSYCISQQTPSNFKPYSRMLWLYIWADSFVLITTFVFQIRAKIYGNIFIQHICGPFAYFSRKTQITYIWINVFAFMIGTPVLVSQFWYRYQTVKNGIPPTFFKTCFYFLMAVVSLIPHDILTYYAFYTEPKDLPLMDYGHFWFKETPIPPLIVSSIENPAVLMGFTYAGSICTICYIIVIILSRKTTQELSRQSTHLTGRAKSLQKQFSRILFFQSLAPLFTSILPVLMVGSSVIFNLSTMDFLGELVYLSFHWYPALNSLTSLVLIVPYRRFWLKKFFNIESKRDHKVGSTNQSTRQTVNSTSQISDVLRHSTASLQIGQNQPQILEIPNTERQINSRTRLAPLGTVTDLA